MPIPDQVLRLIDRFQRDVAIYRSPAYKEAEVRQEFIDPLFEALGWDVGNRQGAGAAFRDVVVEFSLKIGDKTKAPDYLFRTGGERKFFVEAKKPAVNLKEHPEPAYQLRRYAWTAELPLSVLTDFEELSIYDCRVKPNKADKATVARTLYIPYTEYEARWPEITALFSREAVQQGSLEQFAQAQKAPKGSSTVDVAFLQEVEHWRELLARNIVAYQPELTPGDLNFAVQMTLDRIIFLRIAEDRGIEPYGRLQALQEEGDLYKRLCALFRDADDRYNSGLFHFEQEHGRGGEDRLTLGLHIDNEPLREIIRHLYYPDSPYEFSMLPVEVLGRVYEQLLGKVITIGANRKVTVEEKPEVRKAGGVYYTPQYIVDYIVQNTVGKLLDGKTPKQAAQLRIIDPACGSGSFLLGAYQYLLDWHLQQYLAAGPQKARKELYQGPDGEWRLTSQERKRILLNNIYGVDLDAQAVEVTKLSLSLKVLEGETAQSVGTTLQMFRERALPDLDSNITCGNALIGYDFQCDDEGVQRKVNALDWTAAFPTVMAAGGFDAVIGNPPYINLKRGFLTDAEKDYFNRTFRTAIGQYDAFTLFMEQALRLLSPGGLHAFIVPKPVLASESYEPIRSVFLDQSVIVVADSGAPFDSVAVESAIIVVGRQRPPHQTVHLERVGAGGTVAPLGVVPQDTYQDIPNKNLSYLLTSANAGMIRRMLATGVPLRNLAALFSRGIEAGKKADAIGRVADSTNRPLLRGEDVTRYALRFAGLYYAPSRANKHEWKDEALYECPEKLIIRRVANTIIAGLDTQSYWTLNTLYSFVPVTACNSRYLLACLNSKLLSYFFRVVFLSDDKLFPYVRISQLELLPIVTSFPDAASRARHDNVVDLVGKMLDLQQRAAATRTPQDERFYQSQIAAVDRQIDALVYELYGLTDVEIRLVEAATM
jgi:predicted type IV restriction endonuclease